MNPCVYFAYSIWIYGCRHIVCIANNWGTDLVHFIRLLYDFWMHPEVGEMRSLPGGCRFWLLWKMAVATIRELISKRLTSHSYVELLEAMSLNDMKIRTA